LLKNLAIQSAASRPVGLAGCCEALCSSAAERRDYVASAVSRQQFFFASLQKNRTSMLPFSAPAALFCSGRRTIAKACFEMQGVERKIL